MSLQFILGNSGSGKTEYIYRKIVKRGGRRSKEGLSCYRAGTVYNADTETAGKAFFKPCHHEY